MRGAKRRGVGVGVHGNADVGEDASEAQVRLHPDGSAFVISCQSEHGTGQSGNVLKMAAEVLQISLDKVTLSPADSLFTPYEFGPAGSRGTYAIGSAVIAAAEDARRQLLELLAPRFHVAADELDTEDGVVFVKEDPERRLPWRAIGLDRTVTGYGRFEPDHTLSNCLMSFVELEVDTNTGRVELLRVVNATDVGRIIDPLSLEGQLNGCLGSAGIDGALWEETVLDSGTGRILNCNLLDYKWRTTRDLPIIENVVLETPVASHRFGALGVGRSALLRARRRCSWQLQMHWGSGCVTIPSPRRESWGRCTGRGPRWAAKRDAEFPLRGSHVRSRGCGVARYAGREGGCAGRGHRSAGYSQGSSACRLSRGGSGSEGHYRAGLY